MCLGTAAIQPLHNQWDRNAPRPSTVRGHFKGDLGDRNSPASGKRGSLLFVTPELATAVDVSGSCERRTHAARNGGVTVAYASIWEVCWSATDVAN